MASLIRVRSSLRGWFIAARPVELLEGVVGVLVVGILDVVLFTPLGFDHADLFALWVIVLAVAARYGAPSGYIAGAAAAAAFEVLELIPADPAHPPPVSVQLQPFLLFISGVLVSEAVRVHKRRFAQLERKQEEMLRTQEDLRIEVARQAASNEALERQIMMQPSSVALVCEYARRLAQVDPARVHLEVVDIVFRLLECQSCALYTPSATPTARGMELKAAKPEAGVPRPTVLNPAGMLLARVFRERQVVTVRDVLRGGQIADPPDAPQEPFVMAGPLLTPDGRVLGVMVVEDLPFAKFTPGAIRLFQLILDWVSAELAGAPNS